jgi:hypothetical protein
MQIDLTLRCIKFNMGSLSNYNFCLMKTLVVLYTIFFCTHVIFFHPTS